ncbi:MAG TPA: tail fiber protein [Terriglobia bacterium]|nr:tail fiber protein [Terriglobia bacterium]
MEPFLGEIRLFPYNFVPERWRLCDGSLLQIAMYTALFALIGTSFGGDGKTTFALPDLRSKVPLTGQGSYCIALQGVFPQRS